MDNRIRVRFFRPTRIGHGTPPLNDAFRAMLVRGKTARERELEAFPGVIVRMERLREADGFLDAEIVRVQRGNMPRSFLSALCASASVFVALQPAAKRSRSHANHSGRFRSGIDTDAICRLMHTASYSRIGLTSAIRNQLRPRRISAPARTPLPAEAVAIA